MPLRSFQVVFTDLVHFVVCQVMMPPGAAESRGNQKAALAGVLYDKKTDPTVRQGAGVWQGDQRVRHGYGFLSRSPRGPLPALRLPGGVLASLNKSRAVVGRTLVLPEV